MNAVLQMWSAVLQRGRYENSIDGDQTFLDSSILSYQNLVVRNKQ